MVALSTWVEGNWFNLIQTVGIVGSLILAMAAAKREAKTREIENLLTISGHHRELWGGARQKEELERIFREDDRFLNLPITVAEEGIFESCHGSLSYQLAYQQNRWNYHFERIGG